MTYTNPWDVTTPAGTEQAKKIDDHFRRLRLDLQERLLVLFTNMTADPVVVKDEIKGKKVGKKLFIPYSSFVNEASIAYDAGGYVLISADAQPVRASVMLPVGVIVKKIRWLVDSADTGQITLKFRTNAFAEGASPTTDNSQTKAVSGPEIKDSGTITFAIDGTRYCWLEADKISGTNTWKIYAVEITYDTDDSRSTM